MRYFCNELGLQQARFLLDNYSAHIPAALDAAAAEYRKAKRQKLAVARLPHPTASSFPSPAVPAPPATPPTTPRTATDMPRSRTPPPHTLYGEHPTGASAPSTHTPRYQPPPLPSGPPDTVFSDQPPVGADPRYSPALGPWGGPPFTIYAKGKDDTGQGKGKSSGKDKGIDYGKAKGKHKTKDKRASPYKGGSYACQHVGHPKRQGGSPLASVCHGWQTYRGSGLPHWMWPTQDSALQLLSDRWHVTPVHCWTTQDPTFGDQRHLLLQQGRWQAC